MKTAVRARGPLGPLPKRFRAPDVDKPRGPQEVLLPWSQRPWSPARLHLVSLLPTSLCRFHKKFYQGFYLPHKKEAAHCPQPAPSQTSAGPQSPRVCVPLLPITCTNSIRKRLSTPSLFTFKGLNSLFTGLSTSRGPNRAESPVRFCVARSLVWAGLFLLLSCNIHDNPVGLF